MCDAGLYTGFSLCRVKDGAPKCLQRLFGLRTAQDSQMLSVASAALDEEPFDVFNSEGGRS
jgi:hypothetical protein